ncbi:hypothetical protein GS493_25010 [Rhodococcus hoagii]|nr:hypothetical protein [Prescottella equi]
MTKRTKVEAGGSMEWIDGNIGSRSQKVPGRVDDGRARPRRGPLRGVRRRGSHQDTGAKMLHLAPHTSSTIVSKSVARGGGRASYRGLVQVNKAPTGRRRPSSVTPCWSTQISRSDTYPYVDVREDDVTMGHEATVSKVSDDQLFYLIAAV